MPVLYLAFVSEALQVRKRCLAIVLKSQRGESSVQFIETARELVIFTRKCCLKMPKRYTFFGEQTICNLADDVYNHVRYANAVFPICKADVEARRIAFNKATGSLHALAGHIDIMAEVLSGNPECESWLYKAMEHWGQLIDEELKMINSVRNKDKERFKKIMKEGY